MNHPGFAGLRIGPWAFRQRSACFAAVAFFVLLGWSQESAALEPNRSLSQYNTRTWRRVNRLPANAVTAIRQSADGHMWLGTPRGLVDFDGVEFKTIGLPGQNDTHSVNITCLAPRKDGGLWVGTERGGYGWFDGARFFTLPNTNLGGSSPTLRSILEMQDGSLFISAMGTVGRRLTTGVEEVIATESDVLCVYEDDRGRVWVGTANNGLYFWENGKLSKLGGAAGQLVGNHRIHTVTIDHQGVIWIGADNGLHRLAADLSPLPPIGYPGEPSAVLVDSHGALWIGGMFNGLARYHDGVLSTLTRNDGLASDRVLALAESADGSLWVGTEDGLTQLSEVKFPILSRSEGLSGDSSMAVAADPAGGVWVGTNSGLTYIVDGHCTSYGASGSNGFPSEWIRRVLVARNGDIYTMGGNQEINRLSHGQVIKTWQPGFWSQSMVEDEAGIVFTLRNKLHRLVNDEIVPYRLADGSEPDFGWISQLLVARDGTLWIAAHPGVLQIRRGELIHWTPFQANEDLNFFNLCEDDSGAIWASRSSGLVRIKDGKVSTVDQRQGLHTNLIYTSVPDLQGNLWMDSPQGVFRVSQSELNAAADRSLPRINCTIFDGTHVIKATEKLNSEYSGCRTTDGKIWLSNAKGVIQIDPAHLPVNSRPPPIQLLRFRVNGRGYPLDQTPKLEPGARNLEFEYTAIDYQAPEQIRYRYRLEGFQIDWTDLTTRQTATFTNIPPGNYRFQVQASNADGIWTPEGISFLLTLPPALSETWWFRSTLVAAGFGLLALIWIIRERRRRRELAEIRHREELQMQMIESSPVPMVMLNNSHRVLHVNEAFTRVFGYAAAEIPDLGTWWRLASTDPTTGESWASDWDRRFTAAATTGRSLEPVETTLAHKDKSPRHIVITTSVVGERTLVICSDLTERKQAEDQRHRLEEQLRQGQKLEAIGRLAGGIAHDFNNLLTVILGNVSQLELDVPSTPDTDSTIHHIKNAAKRAASLTSQMLSFSRKQPLQVTGVDLGCCLHEMSTMLQRIVGDDIVLEVQSAASRVPVRADVSKIEQMLINLVINARDAMPRGGRLTLGTDLIDAAVGTATTPLPARPGRFARITVSDSGTGISPEILPRIFDPFFTTKEVGKGTGLGLATVYGIVEQHEGWIDVQSEPGRGTTFHIHLPVDPNPPPVPPPAPVAILDAAPPRQPAKGSERCVLLVEDDTGVRDYARRILVRQGYTVIEAASGRQALPLWEQYRHKIEIVFTDVVMPGGINGLELGQRLQAEKPDLKIIYASGYSADVVGGDFSGRQGLDFLAKPYLPADLIRILDRTAGDRK